MKNLSKGLGGMHSIKKALIFGFLVWLIPFAISFVINPIRQSNRIMFESIMPVVLAGVVVIFIMLYFKNASSVSVWEGLRVGLIWFAIWSSIVHGGIMAVQAIVDETERANFLGDITVLFVVAIVLVF